jgi:outer membrane protein OmpA-like peptidoglycan-associated protein
MKLPMLVAVFLIGATGVVGRTAPRARSQHPRVGELCEIHFEDDSATVPPSATEKLGQVAGWAAENPEGLIVLDGHADRTARSTTPQPDLAIAMALDRAKAVRDLIVKAGVDPDQIVIAAFGADSARPEGNARVVVYGTHQDLDQVVASRRRADAIVAGR